MNRNEMIEKAAQALRVAVYPSMTNKSWDNLSPSDQEHYLHAAHATLEAVDALPPAPLPIKERGESR